ncbi:MAG: cobalamin biosynthesis protein [Candidatus Bathyarchaeota archaeon]|nr:cobalamin biosynthesis protein [Candidatus Bathyarchaeota archaeon]
MFERGIAVIAITRRGVETALKIQSALDKAGLSSKVYAPKKFSQYGVVVMEKNLTDFIKDTYSTVDALVAVMATGIIIRAAAPLLESKLTDPAVLGVDATGKFVISLLSGHYGGANQLTRIIAKGIGATPVITTASEVTGKISVDELAKILHLSVQNPKSLVAVNAAIVNEENVVLVVVGDVKFPLELATCYEIKKAQSMEEALEVIGHYDAGVIVTNKPLSLRKTPKPVTVLKTKKIVVGLGARKEISPDSIVKAVQAGLAKAGLSLAQVDGFATVDIKRDSKPMLDAVEQLGGTLEFLSVDALNSLIHSDLSPDSAMVQQKIGVGGVCERAALIAAGNNSKLILKKTKLDGVTVAIAEAE